MAYLTRCRRFGFAACVSLLMSLGVLLPAAAAPSHRAESPRALVVVRWSGSYGDDPGRVTIVSLAGAHYPVPARVRAAPLGISPDGRSVAEIRGNSVLVGRVRGGSMRTVLRGTCPAYPSDDTVSCPGADAAYAWSADGRRLAVSASPAHGATQLKVADANGRIRLAFPLPAKTDFAPPPVGPPVERLFHQVLSWSPDGRRLLLQQSDAHGFPTEVVIADLATRKTRTLTLLSGCDSPSLTWSPDGRFIALTTTSTQACRDRFEVFDAHTGRAIIRRSWEKGMGRGGTVWAPDHRSVYGAVPSGRTGSTIRRYDLDGGSSTVLTSRTLRQTPFVASHAGLVYGRGNWLYLYRFSNRTSTRLDTGDVKMVLPIARLP